MMDLGVTIKKNSKEIKNLLENLDYKKCIKLTYDWKKQNVTKEDFLNFFKKNYAFIGIQKYKDLHYSFHNGNEFYQITE